MAAADAKEEEPEERECRICRGEGEENNPLYVPCDCRGSIRYCHLECLLEWLRRSESDRLRRSLPRLWRAGPRHCCFWKERATASRPPLATITQTCFLLGSHTHDEQNTLLTD